MQVRDMLSSNEEENDMFFDSMDCWSSEEFTAAKAKRASGILDYDVWLTEPLSVEKRREHFLCEMEFADNASLKTSTSELGMEFVRMDGLRRIAECSKAASSSFDLSHSDMEDDGENFSCRKLEGDQHEEPDAMLGEESNELSSATQGRAKRDIEAYTGERPIVDVHRRKIKNWWKFFVNTERAVSTLFKVSKPNSETNKNCRMKVRMNKKEFMELTALYLGQEIRAHKGCIWSMKFSPDGQHLASGGEDGVLRVWRVNFVDGSRKYLAAEGNFDNNVRGSKSRNHRKHSNPATVIIPEKAFQIEESTLLEFHGHSGDILDLVWSNSNCILSSSMDKTVRLWQVDCKQCLDVFHHPNYVTCIQFNPVDENYFLSGSVDGKVRIWGISEKRVIDWAEVRGVITAICYQPDGNQFAVGTMEGTCSFYEASGEYCNLEAQICIQGRKKASGRRITGIQVSNDESKRMMITSEDSKLHILDGTDVIHKYKGLPNSGSQISASFTSDGKHIISVGDDSRVYLWNYEGLCLPFSKQTKSTGSCEHFISEGASIAIPWLGIKSGQRSSFGSGSHRYCSQRQDHSEDYSWSGDLHCFALSNCFSTNAMYRGSTTWPEEKLPPWDFPDIEYNKHDHKFHHDHDQQPQACQDNCHGFIALPDSWGLVIVTAGNDGTIRAFHNYGLPVRI